MKYRAPIMAIVLLVLAHAAAASDYSKIFVDTYGSNYTRRDLVTSTELVDTNNVSPKLNSTIVLARAKELGELAGVHIGMSMDEVVAHWGKPPRAWAYCGRGPRFLFSDVCVDFEDGRVRALSVAGMKLSRNEFSGGVSADSGQKEWRKAMGEPTGVSTNGSLVRMWYSTNGIVTYLSFGPEQDGLFSFYIRREPGVAPLQDRQ